MSPVDADGGRGRRARIARIGHERLGGQTAHLARRSAPSRVRSIIETERVSDGPGLAGRQSSGCGARGPASQPTLIDARSRPCSQVVGAELVDGSRRAGRGWAVASTAVGEQELTDQIGGAGRANAWLHGACGRMRGRVGTIWRAVASSSRGGLVSRLARVRLVCPKVTPVPVSSRGMRANPSTCRQAESRPPAPEPRAGDPPGRSRAWFVLFVVLVARFTAWGVAADLTTPMVAGFQTHLRDDNQALLVQLAYFGAYFAGDTGRLINRPEVGL